MKKLLLLTASLLWAACLALALAATADAAPRAIGGFFKQTHQKNYMARDQRGEYNLLHKSVSGIGVDKELRASYPLLTKAINEINQGEFQRIEELSTRMKDEAASFRETAPDYYHPFQYEFDVLMRRADTMAVSFLQYEYTGGSGVHGMYHWQGVNLSTVTGAPLPLEAVVRDKKALAGAICERLRADYPDSPFAQLDEKMVEKALTDQLNWTLDPQGLTFYFNPYEIASYAEGLLTATILFKERPDLFQGPYRQPAAAYAQPFPAYYPLTTSLRDNGERDVISVYEAKGSVHVMLNGTDNAFPVDLADLQPVLIHMEDGRNYLYIDGTRQGKSIRNTLVVQLGSRSARYVDTLAYSFRHTIAVAPRVQEYWHFLTNPNGFCIDQESPFISTSKTDICAIGENGTLTFG